MKKSIELIRHNKVRHDSVVSEYDKMHVEIFNTTEQALTDYKTIILNGENLSNIKDDSFDMVATYSVLHHVPDYLKIVDEFVRVLKPGGVIYIDHEVSPSYWEINDTYQSYLEELGGDFGRNHLYELGITEKVSVLSRLSSLLSVASWKRLIRMFARIEHEQLPDGEGDIHVYKHDHIEWEEIKSKLLPFCHGSLYSFEIKSKETLLWSLNGIRRCVEFDLHL